MEKETLQKIYLLRKIKPDQGFVSRAKEDILSRPMERNEVSILSYLNSVSLNSSFSFAGAFLFLLVFGFLALPLSPTNYQDNFVYLPSDVNEEKEEEVRMVAEEEEMTIATGKTEKPVKREFAALEDSFRAIQRQVLSTMIDNDTREQSASLTDKEIVEYHIAKIEESNSSEVGVMTMSVGQDDRLDLAKEALEKEDYGQAFDIIVDIYSEEE